MILALPEVVAFDLTIPLQVFGGDGDGNYRVTVCGLTAGPLESTLGLTIQVDAGLEALAEADTVIVPGFASRRAPAHALDALRAAHGRGARVASICSGAFALAQAGLLDGRRATTHWFKADQLAAEHPAVQVDPSVLYVDEGDVLTGAGLAAGLDLCLYMVSLDHGEEAALSRSRSMVTPLHRAGGQAQFIPAATSALASDLSAVTEWALERLDAPLTVDDMARQALQASRTFARNFQAELGISPHAWLTGERLRRACALLENDDVAIEEVARRSGLGSAANLRLHFRRAFSTTPSAYRSAFRTSV